MTDLLTQIREDREKGTPGPWLWATSNSWLRLIGGARQNEQVLTPTICADGHPSCNASYDDQRRIARVPEMEQVILDQAKEIARLRFGLLALTEPLTVESHGDPGVLREYAKAVLEASND